MSKVFAKVKLLSSAEGGRSMPLPLEVFGCPMFIEGIPELSTHAYDCRLLLSPALGRMAPGDIIEEVGIVFLSPEEVLSYVNVGTRFTLWEGRTIAHGEVLRLET
jgi:hypothetical protein